MPTIVRVKISHLGSYLPAEVVSSAAVEARVNRVRPLLPVGSIVRFFGVDERRYAQPGEQVSDLATKAALPIVEKVGPESIDCLIFAAASSDLVEPATVNIVQEKLGLTCPGFDVKNACNSFVNGIQTASAFIQAGIYRQVLVVNGELLYNAIKFDLADEEELKRRFAAFTLGDAGAAALLCPSDDESGLVYQAFKTVGRHWPLCTIPGGGSLFPHQPDKNYFEGSTSSLRGIIMREAGDIVEEGLHQTSWDRQEIKHVFAHQVSVNTFQAVARETGIPLDRFPQIVSRYGNIAAASIPVAMHAALQQGLLQKGDKVLLIGMAAGISISVQFLIW